MNKGTTEIQKQLGKNIAIARKKAGITQEQLAERIDVQTLSISRIERGSVAPSLSTISKIAKILNIPITRLFINSQITQNMAQNIADLLTTLSENHRTFIYDQVRQWCDILYKTQKETNKTDSDSFVSAQQDLSNSVHYNNIPTSLELTVHQSQAKYLKDKVKSDK